jgi:hypothetical protein
MKSGFPFSRALAAWNRERVRGPLLAMVFLLLGVVLASSGALSHYQGASNVPQSARPCPPPPGKRNEFFLHNLGNAPTDVCQRAGKQVIFRDSKSNFSPPFEFVHEEV